MSRCRGAGDEQLFPPQSYSPLENNRVYKVIIPVLIGQNRHEQQKWRPLTTSSGVECELECVCLCEGDFFMQSGRWSRTIRAAFDLLFMMCHLIASISPYRTLLVPLYHSMGWERSQEESRRERWKKTNWRLSWGGWGGTEPENPMNPINRTDDRKKRTRERNR